jgi:hypothetical protein
VPQSPVSCGGLPKPAAAAFVACCQEAEGMFCDGDCGVKCRIPVRTEESGAYPRVVLSPVLATVASASSRLAFKPSIGLVSLLALGLIRFRSLTSRP